MRNFQVSTNGLSIGFLIGLTLLIDNIYSWTIIDMMTSTVFQKTINKDKVREFSPFRCVPNRAVFSPLRYSLAGEVKIIIPFAYLNFFLVFCVPSLDGCWFCLSDILIWEIGYSKDFYYLIMWFLTTWIIPKIHYWSWCRERYRQPYIIKVSISLI